MMPAYVGDRLIEPVNLRGLVVFGETSFVSLFVLAGIAVMIFFMLMRSHRYFSRQDRSSSPIVKLPRHGSEGKPSARLTPDEVNRWQVEMHETARDLSAQLDSKMSALAHLIRDADRVAARLEKALASTEHPSTSSDSVGLDLEKLEKLPSSQADGLHRSEPVERDNQKTEASDTKDRSEQRRYEEIYTLSDYGFDAAEIANRLDTPIGEIELILGLRDKR